MPGWGKSRWGTDYWGGDFIPAASAATADFSTGWGKSYWGTSLWGGDGLFGIYESGTGNDSPFVLTRYPGINAVDILENVTISIRLLDVNDDLEPTSIKVFLDGVKVYDGVTGFSPSVIGVVTYPVESAFVQISNPQGYCYGQMVTVRVQALDSQGNGVDEIWTFTIREDPTQYVGSSPLPIEVALQEPFQTYIGLDPLRTLFLNANLRTQFRSIPNRGNKEARVTYQSAYATELNAILTPFALQDTPALGSRVIERLSYFNVSKVLDTKKLEVVAAIKYMRQQGLLTDEYSRAFSDYADSSLYIYRVSLIANMLLFAKAVELNA